jgi:hypothetical protein
MYTFDYSDTFECEFENVIIGNLNAALDKIRRVKKKEKGAERKIAAMDSKIRRLEREVRRWVFTVYNRSLMEKMEAVD